MDIVTQINEVIEYIETHLSEKNDYEKLAKIACCSVYNLQRIFVSITNISIAEYIRKRRMSLAASDIINSDERIIDIAAKYGYESPESFNRSFQKVYNMPPSLMRKNKPVLKTFSRLSLSMEIEKIGRNIYMKNCIDYNFEFSGFWGRNFNNCFSSAYKYLTRNDKRLSLISQEDFFFFFGTMSGQNVTRLPFDETAIEPEWMINNTVSQIEFIMGFTGFDYTIELSNFKESVKNSIDIDKPVIAKLKENNKNGYNLIIGFDEEKYVCPNFNEDSSQILSDDDIELLYILGDKKAPKYTYLDGLKRIVRILEHNREKNIWGELSEKFNHYWEEGLNNTDINEVKKRFNRTAEMMWHAFNCHNLGESMGRIQHSICGSTTNVERYKHACELIGDACFTLHLNAWIPVEINHLITWNNEQRNYNAEWALGNAVKYAIDGVNCSDKMLLDAFKELIEITV